MKPYPAYKDSGIEWLGKIPAGWDTVNLKFLSTKIGSGITPRGGSTVYQKTGIPLLRSQNIHFDGLRLDDVAYISHEIHDSMGNTKVQPNDVLLNITGASIGRCFYVNEHLGEANVNQHVCIVRPNNRIETKFLFNLLASQIGQFQVFYSQNGTSREGLNFEQLKNFTFPLPPLPEQRAIAAFLDHKTRLIDTFVAKKQQQIERLLAYRTALINQAVTKGLNPDAPMKDSRIEWLGEIPAHWEIHSFRRIIKSIEQGWSPIAENRLASPTEWAVIKLNAVKQGVFQPEEHKVLPENVEVNEHYKIKNGDFLLTRANTPDLVGDVCIAENIPFNLLLSDLVYRISVEEHKSDKKYLCYWFLSAGRHQIMSDARGSSQSMVKISQSHIRAWTIITPPLFEQKAIASFLNTETAKIDTLIATTQQQIDRLQAYRTALISDAVTGKIDVRMNNYTDDT